MACNSCTKSFNFLRKEKGCSSCGFGYCSSCLNHTAYVAKLKTKAKVCAKCEKSNNTVEKKYVQPPDAYFNRTLAKDEPHSSNSNAKNDTLDALEKRLQKLKEDKQKQVLSDEELHSRLANLKGVPNIQIQNKPLNWMPNSKTEAEQANELMKQYMEQANIDKKYKLDFEKKIDDIQARIAKLRSNPTVINTSASNQTCLTEIESEDEDTEVNKLIEKIKTESLLANNFDITSPNQELPFCEICNEDAKVRCLGCQYLFCFGCYSEHKNDDDGCNKFEPFAAPNSV